MAVEPELDYDEIELFRVREAKRYAFRWPILIALISTLWLLTSMLGQFSWGGLAILGLTIAMLHSLILVIPWRYTFLMVTNQNVHVRNFTWSWNWLSKQDIPLHQISARKTSITPVQAFLKVATIFVDSSAAGEIIMPSVSNAEEVLRNINQAQNANGGKTKPSSASGGITSEQIREIVRQEVSAALAYLDRLQIKPVEERLTVLWKLFKEGGVTQEQFEKTRAAILTEVPPHEHATEIDLSDPPGGELPNSTT